MRVGASHLAESTNAGPSASVVRSVTQILLANVAVSGIQVLTGLLTARWIPPADMGVWNSVNLVTAYTPFLTLGIYSGLNRELPLLMGAGKEGEAHAVARAAYAWAWILAAGTAPITAVLFAWYLWRAQPSVAWTVVAVGVSALFGWFASYLATTYRTHTEFGRLALANGVVAAMGLLLMLLVRHFGYWGLLWRAGLMALLAWAALFYKRPVTVSASWNRSAFLQLLKVGAPVFLVGQVATVFVTLDRVVLLDSQQAIGLFTLAGQVGTGVRMIPAAFTNVIFPVMARQYGKTGKASELWWLAARTSVGMIVLGAAVGVVGWFVLPPFVRGFLPAYLAGLSSAQWASFHGAALGFHVFAIIFNVIRRQDLYVACLAVGAAAFAATWMLRPGVSGVEGQVLAATQAMLAGALAFSMSTVPATWFACLVHDKRKRERKGVR